MAYRCSVWNAGWFLARPVGYICPLCSGYSRLGCGTSRLGSATLHGTFSLSRSPTGFLVSGSPLVRLLAALAGGPLVGPRSIGLLGPLVGPLAAMAGGPLVGPPLRGPLVGPRSAAMAGGPLVGPPLRGPLVGPRSIGLRSSASRIFLPSHRLLSRFALSVPLATNFPSLSFVPLALAVLVEHYSQFQTFLTVVCLSCYIRCYFI